MSLNNIVMGEGYVPAYQISATPFVTSSLVALGATTRINFDTVTRFFTVKNNGAATSVVAVAFTENGLKTANSNFFVLSGSETFTAEIRTDRLFISGAAGSSNVSILAGLTQVPVKNFYTITGSNGFGSVG
jgi:hypothetical protein